MLRTPGRLGRKLHLPPACVGNGRPGSDARCDRSVARSERRRSPPPRTGHRILNDQGERRFVSVRGELLMRKALAAFALLTAVPALPAAAQAPALAASIDAAHGMPDRIVLSPGADPAREMAVAYRTDVHQPETFAEITPAGDGPAGPHSSLTSSGQSRPLVTQNGPALHHQVRFTGLRPDTAYLYRVRGSGGWSEWFQFRTAAAEPRAFSFLYFGDAQNDVHSRASRVFRQAFLSTASPALAVHAGDLVNQRGDDVHDDEWAGWAEAGGHLFASVPQLPAAGNHEYVDAVAADGSETRELGPHWPLAFALPDNGATGAEATTYHIDYQGVRFIILDGTAALDLGALESQTRWLETLLASNPNRWTVLLFHQPLFTCARPEDTIELQRAWRPLIERHGVDLVLQGHDHCYSRLTDPAGREASAAARSVGSPQGPVYMVSVAGPKMYGLNDRADHQPDRTAEDTQLYQSVRVEQDRLAVRSHTATGRLYDAFDIVRLADGSKRLEEPGGVPEERRCDGGAGPDGAACTARPK